MGADGSCKHCSTPLEPHLFFRYTPFSSCFILASGQRSKLFLFLRHLAKHRAKDYGHRKGNTSGVSDGWASFAVAKDLAGAFTEGISFSYFIETF